MEAQELYTRIRATKAFLNREIVRNKRQEGSQLLDLRQIGKRMDMIHEAERIGVRHLGEHQNRKLTKMMSELEQLREINLN